MTKRYVVTEQDAGIHGRYAVVDTRDGEVMRRTQTKGEAKVFVQMWNADTKASAKGEAAQFRAYASF